MVTGAVARRGGAAGDRREGGGAGELPPARLHDVDARHPPGRRAGQQDGPRRLRRRRVFDRHRRPSTASSSTSSACSPPASFPVAAATARTSRPASAAMPWYAGPDRARGARRVPRPSGPPVDQPFRMPVQDVYKFTAQGDDRRIVAGTIDERRDPGRRRGRLLPLGQEEPGEVDRSVQPAGAAPAAAGQADRLHAARADLRRPRRAGDAASGEPRPT